MAGIHRVNGRPLSRSRTEVSGVPAGRPTVTAAHPAQAHLQRRSGHAGQARREVVQLLGVGRAVVVLGGTVDVLDEGESSRAQRLITGRIGPVPAWEVRVTGVDVGPVMLDQSRGPPVFFRLTAEQ